MKKLIIEDEQKIKTKDIKDVNDKIIATKVPRSNGEKKLFFLVGNSGHRYYFSNLSGYAMGDSYPSAQKAIEARIEGTDCICDKSDVYLFDSIGEVLEELGE